MKTYDSGNLDVLVALLERTVGAARDAYAAASRLETAQETPGTADDAVAERKLTAALAELQATMGPSPVQLPPKLTAAEREVVATAKERLAALRLDGTPKLTGKGAQSAKELLAIVERRFV